MEDEYADALLKNPLPLNLVKAMTLPNDRISQDVLGRELMNFRKKVYAAIETYRNKRKWQLTVRRTVDVCETKAIVCAKQNTFAQLKKKFNVEKRPFHIPVNEQNGDFSIEDYIAVFMARVQRIEGGFWYFRKDHSLLKDKLLNIGSFYYDEADSYVLTVKAKYLCLFFLEYKRATTALRSFPAGNTDGRQLISVEAHEKLTRKVKRLEESLNFFIEEIAALKAKEEKEAEEKRNVTLRERSVEKRRTPAQRPLRRTLSDGNISLRNVLWHMPTEIPASQEELPRTRAPKPTSCTIL